MRRVVDDSDAFYSCGRLGPLDVRVGLGDWENVPEVGVRGGDADDADADCDAEEVAAGRRTWRPKPIREGSMAGRPGEAGVGGVRRRYRFPIADTTPKRPHCDLTVRIHDWNRRQS